MATKRHSAGPHERSYVVAIDPNATVVMFEATDGLTREAAFQ